MQQIILRYLILINIFIGFYGDANYGTKTQPLKFNFWAASRLSTKDSRNLDNISGGGLDLNFGFVKIATSKQYNH